MTAQEPKKRVLIAAGNYADAAAAIRLAGGIAPRLIAKLGGLLVHDEGVADATGLPVQRVVTAGGMLVEAPTRRGYEGLMERDARAFRSGLSTMASTCAVEWTFERHRGELIAGICEAAAGWDLLIVGHRTHRRIGRVVLVDDAQASGEGITAIARRIAECLAMEVTVISMAGPDAAADQPGNGSNAVRSEQELLARINRINAALVITDLAGGPFRGREQLRLLLEVSRCPVLVFNAARAEPAIAHTLITPPPPGMTGPACESDVDEGYDEATGGGDSKDA